MNFPRESLSFDGVTSNCFHDLIDDLVKGMDVVVEENDFGRFVEENVRFVPAFRNRPFLAGKAYIHHLTHGAGENDTKKGGRFQPGLAEQHVIVEKEKGTLVEDAF